MIKRIGRYEVQAELGRGGFGQVFRAFDPTVGRLVAIKTLTASGEQDMITRFRNEAAAAGKLRHHNIVIIYDYGEYEGVPYLVMELLDGEDVERIISTKRQLSLLKKLDIMSQSAAGLHHAHSKGVVHRDVKPANIMLLADGSVKIMDFGIALLTQATAARITPQGSLIGTLPYMAPEQFYGSVSDSLTDIFAYGVTCYKLLTGTHPFHAPEMGGMMYNIMNKAPTPVRALNPECPEALEEAIFKLLAKDRDARYQTLEDAQFDLEPIMLDLRKENVSELLSEARDLLASDQLDAAQPVVRQAIELDPGNRTARELRELLQRQIKDRAVRPKVTALVNAGREQLELRQFDRAIEQFESALKLDKSNPEIHGLVEKARMAWEQAQRADRLLEEARQALHRDDLSGAHRSLAEALAADPNNAHAEELLATVRERMEAREREQRLRESLNQVKRLILLQSFEAAIVSATSILEEYPECTDARRLLETARRDQQAQLRRQRLQAATDEVKELLRAQRFSEAVARLSALQGEFPEAAELRDLASYAADELQAQKQQEAVARATDETRSLVAAGQFDTAIERLHRALVEYPGVSALRDLLQSVDSDRAEHQRKIALDEVMRQGAALVSEGRFAEANERIGAFVRAYGDNTSLDQLRNQAEEGLARQRRLAAVRKLVMDAQTFLDDGKPGEASQLLHEGTIKFPDQSELAALLGIAQENLRKQKTAEAISKMIAEAESSARSKRFKRAIELIDTGQQQYPSEDRLLRCREAIQASRLAYEREIALRETMGRIRELHSQGRRGEALEAIESAMAQGLQDSGLLDLKRRIEAELAEHRRAEDIRRTVEQAEDLLAKGRLDSATQMLEDATRLFPGATQFQRLQEDLEKRRREQERAEALAKAIRDAGARIAAQDFDGAVQLLDAVTKRYGPDDAIARTRASALTAKSAHEREVAIEKERSRAVALLAAGRMDEAVGVVEKAAKVYGEDPRLVEVKSAVERRRQQERADALAKAVRDAGARVEAKDFDGAVQLLDAATARYGPDDAVGRARASALTAKSAHEREVAIEKERSRAVALLDAGRLDEAVGAVEKAARVYGEDARLVEVKSAVERRRQQERADALAKAVRDAEARIGAKDFDGAVQLLDAATARYGPDGAVGRARESALTAKSAYEREVAIEKERSRAVALLDAGRLDEAVGAVEKAAKVYGEDPRLVEVKSAVERRRQQERADALAKAVRDAGARVEAKDFEGALQLLDAATARYGPDGAVGRARESALAAKSAYEREVAIEKERSRAVALLDAGWLDEAVGAVEKALKVYGEDPRFVDVRSAVERRRQQERADALAKAVRDAGARVGAKDFDGAVQLLDAAIARYGPDEEVGRARASALTAKSTYEREVAIERERSRAVALLDAGRLDEAVGAVEKAVKVYGEDPRFVDVRSAVERRRQQERADALAKAVRDAGARVEARDFDGAVRLLDAATARYGPDEAVGRARASALTAKSSHEREVAFEKERSRALALLAAGRLDEAVGAVEKAISVFGENPRLVEVKNAVERADALAKAVRDAGARVEAKDFDGAVQLLDAATARYGPDEAVGRARASALTAKSSHEREVAIEKERSLAVALLDAGRLDEAVGAVEKAISVFGENPRLVEVKNAVGRADALAKAVRDAEARIGAKDFDGAVLLLDAATARYGPDGAVGRARESALFAKSAHEREVAIEKERSRAEALLDAGRLDEAVGAIENTTRLFGADPRLAEVRSAVERRRQQERAEALAKAIQDAGARIKARDFDGAVQLLDAATARYGPDDAVRRTRHEVAIEKERSRAEALLAAGRLDEAVGAIERAAKVYGENPRLAEVRSAVERRRQQDRTDALAKAVQDAGARVEASDFDGAVQLLDAATARYGPDDAVRRTRHEVAIERERSRAVALLAAGRLDEAVGAIGKAVKVYGEDPRFVEVRSAVERRRQQERADALAKAVRDAGARVGTRDFDGALQLLDAATRLYGPDDAVARTRESALTAKSAHEREVAIVNARSRAVELLDAGRPDEALGTIEKAVKALGEDPRLAELKNAAETRQEAIRREKEAAEILRQANDLLAKNQPLRAVQILRPPLALGSSGAASHQQIAELLGIAEEKLREQQRQQAIAAVVEEVGRLRSAGQSEQALRRLDDGLREFPNAVALEPLRVPLAIAVAVDEVNRLGSAGQYDQALRRLDDGLREFPNAGALEQLRAPLLNAKVRAESFTLAKRLHQEGRYEAAAQAVGSAIQAASGDRELLALKAQIESDWARQREEEAVRQALERAQAFIRHKRFDDACGVLKPAAKDYPKQARVTELLRTVEEELLRQQRIRELNEARSQIEAFLSQGKEDQAIALIEGRWAKEPSLQELLTRARKEADRKHLAELVRQAEDFGRNARYAEAVRLAEQAIERYGSSGSLVKLRDSLKRELEEQLRREARERDYRQLIEIQAQAGAKARKKKLQQLDAAARAIAANHPGDTTITATAQAIHSQVESALAVPAINPALKKPLLAGLGVGVAVAAGFVVLHYWPSKPVQKPSLEKKVVVTPTVTTIPMEVRSDPAGASVQVGSRSCITPNCRFDLSPGEYSVEARLKGFLPQQQTIKLDAQHPGVVDLILQPDVPPDTTPKTETGTLVVQTGIPDALVFVDNALKGRTNRQGEFRSDIAAAGHEVRVEKGGYSTPPPQRVTIAAGRVADTSFTLAMQSATLELRGAPSGIVLRTNGTALASTGRNQFSVPAGSQRIQVTNGAETFAVTQNFEPGKTVTLDWNSIAPKVDLEAQEWDRIQNSSDPAQIQSFIDKYGTGPHQAQARSLLERATWSRVDRNDANSLRAYLKSFPNGPHADEAASRLEALAWAAVNQQRPDSIRLYITEFPNGLHVKDARGKIADLAWNGIDKNDEKAVNGFIEQYPDSSHKPDALSLLDQLKKKNLEREQAEIKQRAQQEQAQAAARAQAQGIQTALDSFNSAFSSHNSKQLKDIWPKAPRDYTDRMSDDKNNFVELTLVATGKPVVTGDTARIHCDLTLKAAVYGRHTSATKPHEVLLQKENNRWIITAIN